MKIVESSYTILTPFIGDELERIEFAGRISHKSDKDITRDSAKKFVKTLIKNGHESVLEHGSLSVKFILDRASSHDLVRHRLTSITQESTRYCNYSHDRFGKELTFIWPCFFGEYNEENATREGSMHWQVAMLEAEKKYFAMIYSGCTPQEASMVLPNSLKTELIITANYREWRHILNLRAVGATGPSRPQIEELLRPLLKDLHMSLPGLFDDIFDKWIEKEYGGVIKEMEKR